ncbi:MAG: TonB family protein [Tannerellaceae bacterium]|jgi:TonB family protein|nr:TonB family protein [Tannerellaceae bacterium]
MSQEAIYLLKVNVALVLFYAFYRLFFYKDTFFVWRRSLLLAFLGLAVVYPLLNIQEWIREQEPINGIILTYSDIWSDITVTPTESAGWQSLVLTVAAGCYRTVAALLALRFVVQLGRIFHLAWRSRRAVIGGTNVYLLDKPSGAFSFFRFIFLYPDAHREGEVDKILTHERTHASEWHSIDVVISEWMCILCWMNPFAWLLKREMRYNLEYLADNTVLRSGYDSKSYQYLLLGLTHSHKAAANLYNNFNVSHLKKRISMMNTTRSHAIGKVKYLLFLPLTAALMLFSNMDAIAHVTKKVVADDPSLNPAVLVAEKVVINFSSHTFISFNPATLVAEKPDAPQEKKKTVYAVVETMPQFPGGTDALMKFVNTNLRYPKEAQEKGIQGRVILTFVINDDGRISDIEVTRGVDPLLDAEAVRLIESMPKWTPGKQRGKDVCVKYNLPIMFRLQQGTGDAK